jgi:regulator of sirC expression with transglutaminase-like and TPR domain
VTDFNSEIEALIRLLDDPDPIVNKMIIAKFETIGPSASLPLEKAWNLCNDAVVQDKIELLIRNIHFNTIHTQLQKWVKTNETDLLQGAYILALYQFPELDFNVIEQNIAAMQIDANIEMSENLTPLEKIKVLNHIIFDIHKLSGNYANYYSPFNNYLNHVLNSKKGNPLTLSMIYIYIGNMLGIPLKGINLPHNFIVAYVDASRKMKEQVVFCINPYQKGSILSRKDVIKFLADQKVKINDSLLRPCNNTDMVKRLISNLIYSYEKMGNATRFEELNKLLPIFEDSKEQK